MNKPVYVYSMNSKGQVIERSGIITKKSGDYVIITVYGGQRVVCSKRSKEIYNNTMWSNQPQLRLYAEKMLEILVERRAAYQDRIDATTRRITEVRKYAG